MSIEKHKDMFGNAPASTSASTAQGQVASQIVREIIIPAIEKEVNEGKNFAMIRQVYNAEILATWYKKTLKQSLLGQVFANQSKVAGQKHNDPKVMEEIYQQYLKAYKKGVFNYIKEEPAANGQMIPKKYFSGGLVGFDGAMINTITPESDDAQLAFVSKLVKKALESGKLFGAAVLLALSTSANLYAADQQQEYAQQLTQARGELAAIPTDAGQRLYINGLNANVREASAIVEAILAKGEKMTAEELQAADGVFKDAATRLGSVVEAYYTQNPSDADNNLAKAHTSAKKLINYKNPVYAATPAAAEKASESASAPAATEKASESASAPAAAEKASESASAPLQKKDTDILGFIERNWPIIGLGALVTGLGTYFWLTRRKKDRKDEKKEPSGDKLAADVTILANSVEAAKVAPPAQAAAKGKAVIEAAKEVIKDVKAAEEAVAPAVSEAVKEANAKVTEAQRNQKAVQAAIRTAENAVVSHVNQASPIPAIPINVDHKNGTVAIFHLLESLGPIAPYDRNVAAALDAYHDKNRSIPEMQKAGEALIALAKSRQGLEPWTPKLGELAAAISNAANPLARQAAIDAFHTELVAEAILRLQTIASGNAETKDKEEANKLLGALRDAEAAEETDNQELKAAQAKLAAAIAATAAKKLAAETSEAELPAAPESNLDDLNDQLVAMAKQQDEGFKTMHDHYRANLDALQKEKQAAKDKVIKAEKDLTTQLEETLKLIATKKGWGASKSMRELNELKYFQGRLTDSSIPESERDATWNLMIRYVNGLDDGQEHQERIKILYSQLSTVYREKKGLNAVQNKIPNIESNFNKSKYALDAQLEEARKIVEKLAAGTGKEATDASDLLKLISAAQQQPKADAAALARNPDRLGGINLNEDNLTMNIKVDGNGMPLPAQFQDKAMMNLNGLTSIIRKITPLTPQNVPALYELLK